MDNFQSILYNVAIHSSASTKGELSLFLTTKVSYEQPFFHIGNGIITTGKKIYEVHDDTYCDLHTTFLFGMVLPSRVIHKSTYGP